MKFGSFCHAMMPPTSEKICNLSKRYKQNFVREIFLSFQVNKIGWTKMVENNGHERCEETFFDNT